MKAEQLETMLTLIETKLPYPHTKAERIEELKLILINGEDVSNELAILVSKEAYKLNQISEQRYRELIDANAKLVGLVAIDKSQEVLKSTNNSHLLSMSRKADLLMTNMTIVLTADNPLTMEDARRLVEILEKKNISPLTMVGAIHACWIVILDKEHCINMVKDKYLIIHQLADILRVLTEALVNEIVIDATDGLRYALIKFSKKGSESHASAEYILETPSLFDFLRRTLVRAAINIHTSQCNS